MMVSGNTTDALQLEFPSAEVTPVIQNTNETPTTHQKPYETPTLVSSNTNIDEPPRMVIRNPA